MLTSDGAKLAATWLSERLQGAQIVVANGREEASQDASVQVNADTGEVVLRAEFGEGEANFDWSQRRVEWNGTVFDLEDEDLGRKVQGSVWVAEVAITPVAE